MAALMSGQTKHFYAFGPFRLDPEKRVLVRDDTPVPLAPKAAEALLLLVENAGHLVDKDDLMKRVCLMRLSRRETSIRTFSFYGKCWASGTADGSTSRLFRSEASGLWRP
jgi:DNA-binding response OmpR family regulator